MSDLDLVTKSAIANMANSLPRIAYALEALAIEARIDSPTMALAQHAIDELAKAINAYSSRTTYGAVAARESNYPIVIYGRRLIVRVEIRDQGQD